MNYIMSYISYLSKQPIERKQQRTEWNSGVYIFIVLFPFFQDYAIIIMELCKAPTLWLKALNKHTHIMYIEKEMLWEKKMYISTSVQA